MKNTEKNLIFAYLDEIQARNRYEMFADVAKKQNYFFIFTCFKDIAQEEKLHANLIYTMYQTIKEDKLGKKAKIEIETPLFYGNTIENLENSLVEEEIDWINKYPNFIEHAEIEDFQEIAKSLKEIANSEKNHSHRLKMLLDLIKKKFTIKNNELTVWKCMECGFEVAVEGLSENYICPSCGQLKPYFQRLDFKLTDNDQLFLSKESNLWICMKCGFEVFIDKLPENWSCPDCNSNKSYFKRKKSELITDISSSEAEEEAIWICMECGYEIQIKKLPDYFKCPSCKRNKSYFKRKRSELITDISSSKPKRKEMAVWICSDCGFESKIELPKNWKCPSCGFH